MFDSEIYLFYPIEETSQANFVCIRECRDEGLGDSQVHTESIFGHRPWYLFRFFRI
jgi:hypothetical protein